MKILLPGIAALAFASCSAFDRPNFTQMTASELAAYNAGVPRREQVQCADVQPYPGVARSEYVCVTTKQIEWAQRERGYTAGQNNPPSNAGLSLGNDYLR